MEDTMHHDAGNLGTEAGTAVTIVLAVIAWVKLPSVQAFCGDHLATVQFTAAVGATVCAMIVCGEKVHGWLRKK